MSGPDAAAPERRSEDERQVPDRPPVLLVVDDEEFVLSAIKRLCRRNKIELKTASNASAAGNVRFNDKAPWLPPSTSKRSGPVRAA